MNPFKEKKNFLAALQKLGSREETRKQRAGKARLELACGGCGEMITYRALEENLYVCPHCGCHFSVPANKRVRSVADAGTFHEICGALKGGNPLDFPGYDEKLAEARKRTGMKDAVLTGTCKIHGLRAVLIVMDGRFFMGSMGTALGEKVTRAFEYAARKRLPVIVFAASGGARMQEGILSLFQMAKTSAAVARHNEAGLLYVSVMTHPTTGGVTASFASLADVILAEPGALIGFAGPRVIQQTIQEELPEGFQRAEYLLKCGFVDQVVPRSEIRDTLGFLLRTHQGKGRQEPWRREKPQ